jgi:tellurite resistance protein TehA-like permease
VSATSDPDPAATPDPRPKPQYGEYATPQEVAIARGIPVDRGANEHVARLAVPIAPVAPGAKGALKKSAARAAGLRHAPPPSGRPFSARHPGQRSSMVTVLLLVFGIWNTVIAIPTFLDLGKALTQGFQSLGYGAVEFGSAAHVAGIVMLVFSFLLLIAAVGLSLRRIRAGRSSLWVPLVAGVVWALGYLVATIVVVANTPGVLAVLQNHS